MLIFNNRQGLVNYELSEILVAAQNLFKGKHKKVRSKKGGFPLLF